jgi:type IV pilus assembly protein PilA
MKSYFQQRDCRAQRKSAKGFSLIELLIVVAIILIIAAIAIPNFLQAKMAAHESSAVSSIHAINTAEIQYASSYPTIGFSALLTDLGPAGTNYIDAVLASGAKGGYTFVYLQNTTDNPSDGYTVNVNPTVPGVTGKRYFYSDQQNVTHYNQVAPASAADPAL